MIGWALVYRLMTIRWSHVLRLVAYTVGAILLTSSRTMSQTFGTSPAQPDIDFSKWAVTQGGLVLVVLVLLWSYRNDFKKVLSVERAEHEQTREALRVVSDIAKEYGTHISANTEVLRSMNQTQNLIFAVLRRENP